jgi:hypothetical protein
MLRKVFEPHREEGLSGGWTKLRNEELHILQQMN